MKYVDEHIEITSHFDPINAEKLLSERGAFYCEDATNHQVGHPELTLGRPPTSEECEFMGCAQHDGKPLLSFEADGKCSSIPTSATLVFVRFPDGRIDFFEYGRPLVQMEIAEVLCLCGICHNRWQKRAADPTTEHDFVFKAGKKKNMYAGAEAYGLANRKYLQCHEDQLCNRYLGWIDAIYAGTPADKSNLIKWMAGSAQIAERKTAIDSHTPSAI